MLFYEEPLLHAKHCLLQCRFEWRKAMLYETLHESRRQVLPFAISLLGKKARPDSIQPIGLPDQTFKQWEVDIEGA